MHWGGPWGVPGWILGFPLPSDHWGSSPKADQIRAGNWWMVPGKYDEKLKKTFENPAIRRDLLIGKRIQPISVTPSKVKTKSGLVVGDLN